MSTADSRDDDDDDPFTILGVSRTCTPSALKQVYRELARRYHPDVNPGPEAAARMKRINLAYDRALAELERAMRLRAARASAMTAMTAMTVATQRQQQPSRAMAQVFGRSVNTARAAAPRRGHRRWLWVSLVTGIVVLALVAALVVRALKLPAPNPTTAHGSTLPTLRLGGNVSFAWQDSGTVTMSDQLIAQLGMGVHLNEAPQWSADGNHVAISLAPAGSNGAAASDASTILVMRGDEVLRRLPGTSARWSPMTDQLAVLTGPDGDNAPLLELVSPLSPSVPSVLDTNAATHLAWSDDGTQIAYSANGQQQLRVAAVARGAPRMLDKTFGQRLIPLGWQGSQVIEIVHNKGAVSLVGVDAEDKQRVTLADVDSLATETTVIVSKVGIAYLTRNAVSPFVTFNWLAPTSQQQWSALLPGIQAVRFLAGWSADGAWMALAPASSDDTSAGTSEICFARAPRAQSDPPSSWPLHCLLIPGVLDGMNWEPRSGTLSYVREAQPGGVLELRALHIQSSPIRGAYGQPNGAQEPSFSFLPNATVGLAILTGKLSIITERSRRHFCDAAQRRPTPFSPGLARLLAIPRAPLASTVTASSSVRGRAVISIFRVGCGG